MKSQMTDRSVSVTMTLSDLEGRDAKGQTFLDDFYNYASSAAPTATKFGKVTHVGEGSASGGQICPP